MKNREKKKQNPRDSAGQLLNRGPVSLKRKSVFALSSILFFNSVAPLLSAQTKHEKEMFIKYKPQTESVNDMGDGVMKPVEEKVKALTPVQEVKTKVKDVETQWKSVYDYYYNIFGYTQTAAHLRDLEILEKQCPKLLENKEYKWFKEKIFGSDKPLEELRTKGKFGGVIRKIQEIGNDRNKELDTSSDIIIKTLVEKKESLEKQKEKQEKKFEKGKISKTDYEDFVKKVNDNITEIDKFLQNIKTNSSDTIKTSKNELKYAGLAAIANYTELLRTVGLAIAGGQTYKVEQAQKAFKNEEVINVHSMIGNSFLENMKDINQKSADTTLRTSGVSKDNINKIREIIEKDLNEQTITITKLSKGADKKIISAIENWLDSRGIISKITSSGTLENLEIKIEKVKTVPAIRRFLFSNLKETEFWRMAEAYKNVLKDDKLLKFFLSQKVEWAKPETNKEFMESDLYNKQALILTERQFQQGKARFTVDEYIDIIVGVIHNNEIILRRNSVDCVGVDPEINSSLSKKLKGYEEAKKLISWQMAALLKDCKDYTPAYLLVAQIGTHAYRLLYQAVGKAGLGVPYRRYSNGRTFSRANNCIS